MRLSFLFLKRFFSHFSSSSLTEDLTSVSTSTTSTEVTATGIGTSGLDVMDEEPLVGAATVTSATTTGVTALADLSDVRAKQLYVTQAYIESMPEEQLEEFIVKLGSKEFQVNIDLENEKIKEKHL